MNRTHGNVLKQPVLVLFRAACFFDGWDGWSSLAADGDGGEASGFLSADEAVSGSVVAGSMVTSIPRIQITSADKNAVLDGLNTCKPPNDLV